MSDQNPQIILVEDENEDATTIAQIFNKYNLLKRLNVIKGYDEAYLQKKDLSFIKLIIIDLSIRGKSQGFSLIKKIKEDKKIQSIPLIILSDTQEETEIIELYRLSVTALILKPVNLVKFKKIVSYAGIMYEYFTGFQDTD